MTIWYMNLKDNRKSEKCSDEELKFRICKEKGILAIGWGVESFVNSWQEYCIKAEKIYGKIPAINSLEKMSCGDFVWVKNPVVKEYYLVEIIDKNPFPSICGNLKEFDINSYRLCKFTSVTATEDIADLLQNKADIRHTISQIKNSELLSATKTLIERIEL